MMSSSSGAFLELKPLTGKEAAPFTLMTFEMWRPFALNLDLDPNVALRAVGAFWNGRPCGFALAHLIADSHELHILSVFVKRDFRRQGIGRALIEAMAGLCPPDVGLTTRWSSKLPCAEAFELLIRSDGWDEKSVNAAECTTTPETVEKFVQGRTLGKMKDRLGGFTWTLWADRTEADDDVIRSLTAREDFPSYYNPHQYAESNMIWQANSMILRSRGVPIGWVLTCQHWDHVAYDCQYVRPDMGRMGVAILMIIAMIRRQGELLGAQSAVRYTVGIQTAAFLAISRGPWGLDSCVDHYRACKPVKINSDQLGEDRRLVSA
jgi:GNAT superfamily N-acetyltransferase